MKKRKFTAIATLGLALVLGTAGAAQAADGDYNEGPTITAPGDPGSIVLPEGIKVVDGVPTVEVGDPVAVTVVDPCTVEVTNPILVKFCELIGDPAYRLQVTTPGSGSATIAGTSESLKAYTGGNATFNVTFNASGTYTLTTSAVLESTGEAVTLDTVTISVIVPTAGGGDGDNQLTVTGTSIALFALGAFILTAGGVLLVRTSSLRKSYQV